MKFITKCKDVYEKKYKLLMLIPLIMILLASGTLIYWKTTTGEFISKDVSLKGGILVTLDTDKILDISSTENMISSKLSASVNIKTLKSIGTGGNIGYTFETDSKDSKAVLSAIEESIGSKLESGSYTIEESSSALGASFFKSTIKAIIIGFVFMTIVVFIYFKKLIPGLAVIQSAAFELILLLAIMNIAGIKLSGGSVAALLMIIGYSVDTDILLTTRVLKRKSEGDVMSRIYSSIRTGLTMQITTIAALTVMYIVAPASTLKTIALVLLIGVSLDLIATWITNVGILRWYLERKHD